MKFSSKIALYTLILSAIFIPLFSHAADIRGGSNISIKSESNINENLYVGATNAVVEGTIQGDLSVASTESKISSINESDVIVASGQVILEGETKGDVRIVGGDVFVRGKVDGDLVIVAGSVVLDEGAEILGELLVVSGKITINTNLSEYAHIISGEVLVNSELNNTATITTQKLILEGGSKINGNISYFSPETLSQREGSQINGSVNYNKIKGIKENGLVKQAALSFINFWIVLRFITALILAFLLVYIFKVFSQKTTEHALGSFFLSFLVGLLSLFIIPIISLIFFISLVMMPISLLMMLAYIFFLIVSTALSGIILGALIKKVIKKEDHIDVSFHTATLGIVLLTIVQFVSILGEIIRTLFFVVAFGALLRYIYMNIRWRKSF